MLQIRVFFLYASERRNRVNSSDLVAPLGAPDDGKAPSCMDIGDPAGSMPSNTHLFQGQDYKKYRAWIGA